MLDLRGNTSIREDVSPRLNASVPLAGLCSRPGVEALEREVAAFTDAAKPSAVHRVPTHFGSRLLLQGQTGRRRHHHRVQFSRLPARSCARGLGPVLLDVDPRLSTSIPKQLRTASECSTETRGHSACSSLWTMR
jgi:hypothetical protein